MIIKNSEFIISAVKRHQYPIDGRNEIAFVGRSNVGKSSIINALTNRRKLAKVSQTPGKTRLINFFLINNDFYLVDLPGYGYSNMTKVEKLNTSKLINHYIEKNENISHILFLVDIRHKPTENDRIMYDWLTSKNIPFTIIATKADKIGTTKQKENMQVITKVLFAKENIIPFSSSNKLNLDIIENIILENIH